MFESLVFIFVGIGFFSFGNSYSKVNPVSAVIFIIIFLIARVLNVLICSLLVNIPRKNNILTGRKQFFLIFAGVRGAMAFALALKSFTDFKETGSGEIFLIITLIFIAFTMIYSSLTITFVIKKCDLLIEKKDRLSIGDNLENELNTTNCFNRLKAFCLKLHHERLLKYVTRKDPLSGSVIEKNKSSKDVLTDSKYNRLLDDSDIYDGYVYRQESTYIIDNQGGFSI